MATNKEITVSCIIPAYNEASRIHAVLDAVIHHPLLHEIIVIDDHSTDNTIDIVQPFNVRLIPLADNLGKSWAVAEGIAASTGSHLLFLDADLVGLSAHDITALIEPILQNRADATMSLRRNSPFIWRMIGLDYISGERVFARALLADHLAKIKALASFGLEVWLNQIWLENNLRIAVIRWPNVISPYKASKMGVMRGMMADIQMMKDIFRTISLREACRQIGQMRKNRVR